MLHYSESPPSLHHSPATSDQALPTSRGSTPLTPVGFAPATSRRPEKDRAKEGLLPWFRRPIDVGTPTTSLYIDSPLLEPDFDDHSFPLFGTSPPVRSMVATAAPIDIDTRPASTSPRGPQSSTLTSALQQRNAIREPRQPPGHTEARTDGQEAGRSVNVGEVPSAWPNGAKPISMRTGEKGERVRRESVAQSLTGAMSWGGISVGSWIRDEYVGIPIHSLPRASCPIFKPALMLISLVL